MLGRLRGGRPARLPTALGLLLLLLPAVVGVDFNDPMLALPVGAEGGRKAFIGSDDLGTEISRWKRDEGEGKVAGYRCCDLACQHWQMLPLAGSNARPAHAELRADNFAQYVQHETQRENAILADIRTDIRQGSGLATHDLVVVSRLAHSGRQCRQ